MTLQQQISAVDYLYGFYSGYPTGMAKEEWPFWKPIILRASKQIPDELTRTQAIQIYEFFNKKFYFEGENNQTGYFA